MSWGRSLFKHIYFTLWDDGTPLLTSPVSSFPSIFQVCCGWKRPWPQFHLTPSGWTGTASVSQASSPKISVSPRWHSCGWTGAKPGYRSFWKAFRLCRLLQIGFWTGVFKKSTYFSPCSVFCDHVDWIPKGRLLNVENRCGTNVSNIH